MMQSPTHPSYCMRCSEHLRLRQRYEAALHAWKLHQPDLVNGVYSLDTSRRFRRELLHARSKAANELYEHTVKCPKCKAP